MASPNKIKNIGYNYPPFEMEGHELPGIKQKGVPMKSFDASGGAINEEMVDKVSTDPGSGINFGAAVGSSPAKLPSWLKNVATGGMYGLRQKMKAKKAAKAKAKAEAEAAAAEEAAAGGGTGGDGAHTHGADGGVNEMMAGHAAKQAAGSEIGVVGPGVPGGTGGIGGTAMGGAGLEGQEIPVDDTAVVPGEEEEEIV